VPFQKQWPALKAIAAEIDAAAPALLSIEEPPPVTVRPEPAKPGWLHYLVRRHEGKAYLFAVNDGNADGVLHVSLPDGWVPAKPPDKAAAWRRTPDGFRDELRKLDVRTYEITRQRE
jgi:hypothetical protein